MKCIQWVRCVSAIGLLFCLAMPAPAEETTTLQPMIVTAQKQEETIQEVPISVVVFGEEDVEARNITSVLDIADYVPNLMIFENGMSGMNSPSMRGLHASPSTFSTTTGMYVDGVPVLSGAGFDAGVLGVERIEVLRGPQGTLYGKNAENGAINIITRRPGNAFRGKISVAGGYLLSAGAGDRLTDTVSFETQGPIQKDKLFFGVAGRYAQKDGYIENTDTGDAVNDKEKWYGRGVLRWTPMAQLDISLILSRLKFDDGDFNMTLGRNGAAIYRLPVPQERTVTSNLAGSNDAGSNMQALKMTYAFNDSLILTSISSRRVYDDECVVDWDFSRSTLRHTRKDNRYLKIAQEIRLNYAKDRLKWLLGAYYDNDQNDIDYATESVYPMMAGATSRDLEGDACAFFGNISLPLAGRLSLFAGLRYEQQNLSFKDNFDKRAFDDTWDALSPRAGLEYRFVPELMLYASVSKGYRSGGFNMFAADLRYCSYDPESLWNYEGGVKGNFFGDRLVINGAIYYMDISKMQVTEAVSAAESYVTNAAAATARGAEIEALWRLTDDLSLMTGLACSDVEFDSFKDALGDYAGNKSPYAPEYTLNVGVQYRHSNGFHARADLIGYGRMYYDRANAYSKSAYQTVNAKVGYGMERFDVSVYGKNLFDTACNDYGYGNGYYTIYSDPGEIGVQVTYRF